MKVLILADPLENLDPKTDTGLSMAQTALKNGHRVFWATSQDMLLARNQVFARAARMGKDEKPSLRAISFFDTVWIRKDPPFDASYVTLCWLLALEEKNVLMVNKPSVLLRYHEKMIPFEALHAGFLKRDEVIPTWLFGHHSIPFHEKNPNGEKNSKMEWVAKPWLGFGGRDVHYHMTRPAPRPDTLFQPFLKKVVTHGDRRIFFLNGKMAGDYMRLPASGKIQANLNQGAEVFLSSMTQKEKNICERLGKFLKKAGIILAGADMIDEKISEVNITAPTSFNVLQDLGGPDLNEGYLKWVERSH